MFRDFRFAWRSLLRAPVLLTAAVLTLAAGTGLAISVIAIAYGILLRPLPFREPDSLVTLTVHSARDTQREVGLRLSEVDEWRRRLRAFERVGAFGDAELTMRGAGDPRTVRTGMVTDGFFDVLGIPPAEGRLDGVSVAGTRTAVLSSTLADEVGHGPWRDRGITVGASGFVVEAIMPAGFALPAEQIELWVRADAVPEVRLFSYQDQRRFQMIGRLAPGVSIEQATDDLRRVAREIDGGEEPGRQRSGIVRRLDERGRSEARASIVPFVAGAALVLLIAAANVSGLLAGRAVARAREYAVRRALGGTAAQILRSSLAESLLIAAAGSGLGIAIAAVLIRVFETRAPGDFPNLTGVRIDTPVLIATAVLAVIVALLSAAAPALRAIASDPNAALKGTSDRTIASGGVLRGTLVVGQIALTVVLLVCAGLLMRTVQQIVSAERGFDAADAVAMRLRLTQEVRFDVNDRTPFVNRLVQEVRALPGVVAAGVGSDLPPNGTQLEMTIRMVDENGRESMFSLSPSAVTPGYLEALGVRLLEGRLFDERDRDAAVPTIVISRAAAQAMYPDQNALGREWAATLPGPGGKRVRPIVIGVVADVRHKGLDQAPPPVLFATWERLAPSNAHLLVRTKGQIADLAPALRRIVQQLDPTLPLFQPKSLDEVVAVSIADRRLRLQLAGGFAMLALGLATIALWGAMAQAVIDRRRELAVRLALGATGAAAITLILQRGLMLTGIGVVLGAAGGIVSGRLVRHMLHGVNPSDPRALLAATAIAAGIALAACYIPARRAAAISPSELLRQD
jgi:predicted permease